MVRYRGVWCVILLVAFGVFAVTALAMGTFNGASILAMIVFAVFLWVASRPGRDA